MSKEQVSAFVELFSALPAGRAERNRSELNKEQMRAILTLRSAYTPKEMETLLNLSVYRIHQIVNKVKKDYRRKMPETSKQDENSGVENPKDT